MQDIVKLTGESLLVGKGKKAEKDNYRHPRSWHLLAKQAQQLGFVSAEIDRLALENPDHQVALRALDEARPPFQYKFDDLKLPEFVDSIVDTFGEATEHSLRADVTSFTTTSIGEPIDRRCGRQYFDAYVCDRWMFTLSEFSRPTPESTDITSLFVRKSIFHAFWRLEEEEDEPMPLPSSPGSSPRNAAPQIERDYHNLALDEQAQQLPGIQLENQDLVEWRQEHSDQPMVDASEITSILEEMLRQQPVWTQQDEPQQTHQQGLGESSSSIASRAEGRELSVIPIQDGPGWDLIKPIAHTIQIRRWKGAEWHDLGQVDRRCLWDATQKLDEQYGEQLVLDAEDGRLLCKDDLLDFTGEIVCIAGKNDDVPLMIWPAYEI
ncbi:intracellular transport uso1 [Fusarium mexicanum]|uniref:Intracellular transport uso1 n=1 Tax=Fusarium mexicanum TaxID=751941 RepID=A0A8H5I4Z0_9HYPO|nr:intracellular transport uso1 [Fusarium mexicanum]